MIPINKVEVMMGVRIFHTGHSAYVELERKSEHMIGIIHKKYFYY